MEKVVQKENLQQALQRVCSNKGSPGIDGMSVDELKDYLRAHWPQIREQLLAGRYTPQPVRQVLIPKPGGGTRMLGIPIVLDRFIQQALLQVLSPMYDPTFSPNSYGFRPGRSAHQAVRQSKQYIAQGYAWVVDLDLEKCFDRINHDVLMGRLRITRRSRGVSLEQVIADLNEYLKGWLGYFRLIETPSTLRDLDSWIRRRLRCFMMKRWINNCHTRYHALRALGVSDRNAAPIAGSHRGPWVLCHTQPVRVAMPNRFFADRGLLFLLTRYESKR